MLAKSVYLSGDVCQGLWATTIGQSRPIDKMKKVIYGVNSVMLFFIAYFEYNSDSDKTIIISSLAFLILLTLNLLLGFFSQLQKKPVYKHYYYSAIGIVVGVSILLSIW